MAEYSASVERAVVLGVVQPALKFVRIHTTNPQPHYMRRGVNETVSEVFAVQPGERQVERKRSQQLWKQENIKYGAIQGVKKSTLS